MSFLRSRKWLFFSCQNRAISQKETKISFFFCAPVFITKPLAPVAFVRSLLAVCHTNCGKSFPSAFKPFPSIRSKSCFTFNSNTPFCSCGFYLRNINITWIAWPWEVIFKSVVTLFLTITLCWQKGKKMKLQTALYLISLLLKEFLYRFNFLKIFKETLWLGSQIILRHCISKGVKGYNNCRVPYVLYIFNSCILHL